MAPQCLLPNGDHRVNSPASHSAGWDSRRCCTGGARTQGTTEGHRGGDQQEGVAQGVGEEPGTGPVGSSAPSGQAQDQAEIIATAGCSAQCSHWPLPQAFMATLPQKASWDVTSCPFARRLVRALTRSPPPSPTQRPVPKPGLAPYST